MSPTATFSEIYQLLKSHYNVPDILQPLSTCVFILESPHVQELQYGAPVSGRSGATMSKHIFGIDYARFPLGVMLKKHTEAPADRPRLNAIGLMNVCNIPLQSGAYSRETQHAYASWLAHMNAVRTGNQTRAFAQPEQQEIQTTLVDGLRTKLEPYRDTPMTWIPCGRFAQKFFALADMHDASWTVIDNVPHPSYQSWDRTNYHDQVQAIVQAIARAAAKDRQP